MTESVKADQKTDRSPRNSQSRQRSTRPTEWKPPSMLDAPPPPEGFTHRWIRESTMGYDDRKNVSARLREGFELVRADEYPDWDGEVVPDGKHTGVLGQGGLLLARFPEDLLEQRNRYYQKRTSEAMDAIDNDLLRENDSRMPILKPDRDSKIEFGGKKPS